MCCGLMVRSPVGIPPCFLLCSLGLLPLRAGVWNKTCTIQVIGGHMEICQQRACSDSVVVLAHHHSPCCSPCSACLLKRLALPTAVCAAFRSKAASRSLASVISVVSSLNCLNRASSSSLGGGSITGWLAACIFFLSKTTSLLGFGPQFLLFECSVASWHAALDRSVPAAACRSDLLDLALLLSGSDTRASALEGLARVPFLFGLSEACACRLAGSWLAQ